MEAGGARDLGSALAENGVLRGQSICQADMGALRTAAAEAALAAVRDAVKEGLGEAEVEEAEREVEEEAGGEGVLRLSRPRADREEAIQHSMGAPWGLAAEEGQETG